MRVLVAGGGTAALEFILALDGRADVTLVAPETHFVPRQLLVAEPLGDTPRLRIPLAALAEDLKFTLVRGAVAKVEPHQVTLRSGGTLAYDTLVLAPGAKRLPAFENAIHIGDDDTQLQTLREEIERGEVKTVACVAPTSIGWLTPLHEAAQRLAELGAEIIPTPPADRVVSLPLIRGPRIEGVPTTGLYGLIPIDAHQQVKGLKDVYAIGDATDHPVKHGGVACAQADAAAEHIADPTNARPFSSDVPLSTGRPGRHLARYLESMSFSDTETGFARV